VDNGQGGTVSFAYQNIYHAAAYGPFNNLHRVTTVTTADRGTQVGQWHYDYTNPMINSLGTILGDVYAPWWQANTNSAILYLNAKWAVDPGPGTNLPYLAAQPDTEFRGHALVSVTAPNGQVTRHYFMQGDVKGTGCNPNTGTTGTDIAVYNADTCFTQIRNYEQWRGRESQTDVYDAGGHLLTSTQHTFDNTAFGYPFDYGLVVLNGVWRTFNYEKQRVAMLYEGSVSWGMVGDPACQTTGTCTLTTTNYFYDAADQSDGTNAYASGGQFGNLTRIEERKQDGSLLRRTERWFNTRNTATTYIVDKPWQEALSEGEGASRLSGGGSTRTSRVDRGGRRRLRSRRSAVVEDALTLERIEPPILNRAQRRCATRAGVGVEARAPDAQA